MFNRSSSRVRAISRVVGILPSFFRFLVHTAGLLALAGCGGIDQAERATPSRVPIAMVDVAQDVGLKFVHHAGAVGDYPMPQIMGSGAAMFDYNGDGRLDILLINGGSLASSSLAPRETAADRPASRLFRQESDGRFVDVTKHARLHSSGYGMGVAIGDIDNDGDLDIYLTNYGSDQLFQNNGDETFTEITETAGIANPSWGTAASFFDHDRDGWLDLFVVNYLNYFPGSICEDGSGRRDYCGPESFGGTADKLYRNTSGESGGRSVSFVDISVSSGIATQIGKGLGVHCGDHNGDNRPDIYVANDMEPNRLWIQQTDGTYRDEAVIRGVAVNQLGLPEASMGVASGDFNGDQLSDLFLTHLRGETNTLYIAESPGLFIDRTSASGLGPPSLRFTGFGVGAIDLEHDGDLDLVVVNGRVKRGPPDATANRDEYWADYSEPNQVFLNDGTGVFVQDLKPETAAFRQPVEVSRGLVAGDIDNDGDIDLLVTNAAGPARLYRNDFAKRGNWLTIRVEDPGLHRDSFGARVRVRVGDRVFEREVNPSSSYLSSHDPRVHFGLGTAPNFDSITVHWPEAEAAPEEFPGGAADRALVLTRGAGRAIQPTGQKE